MPNITPTRLDREFDAVQLLWAAVTHADTPLAQTLVGTKGICGSIQVAGTFGGMTVALHGSNDGTNYSVLKDIQGSDMSFTANSLKDFTTACAFIKPVITGGAGANVNIYVIMR
jgi:hypothetical protein